MPTIPIPDTQSLAQQYQQALHALGIATFDVRCTPQSDGRINKVPLEEYWQHKTVLDSPATLTTGCYGFPIPAWLLIIDVDTDASRNKQGDASLTELLSAVPELGLDTFRVQTQSGGWHYYYTKPLTVHTRKKISGYPDIDFLSQRHYAVAPGSTTAYGQKLYQPYGELTLDNIKPAPSALLEMLQRPEPVPSAPRAPEWEPAPTTEALQAQAETQTAASHYVDYLKTTRIAIAGQNGNDTTYKVLAYGRDLGLQETQTYELALQHYNPRCEPEWSREELRTIVSNVYQYATHEAGHANYQRMLEPITENEVEDLTQSLEQHKLFWFRTAKGQLEKNNFQNAYNFLMAEDFGVFVNPIYRLYKYNEFTNTIEHSFPPPWQAKRNVHFQRAVTDSEVESLRQYLATRHGYAINQQTAWEAISLASREQIYHPIRDELLGYAWDGIPRLDTWLIDYAGVADSAYTRAVSAKIVIGAVARVMEPGCKWDYMAVLESPQGLGKGKLLQALAGGHQYYASLSFPNGANATKEFAIALQGKWIIEVSEMDGLRESTTEATKKLIDNAHDRRRVAYEKVAQDFPRQCIFVGSVNPTQGLGYLKDHTGNRRFWPLKIGETEDLIDVNTFKRVRHLILAEAVVRYQKKELLWLTGAAAMEHLTMVQNRELYDPWHELLDAHYHPQNGQAITERATVTHLAVTVLGLPAKDITPKVRRRIVEILNRLGCKQDGYQWLPPDGVRAGAVCRLQFDEFSKHLWAYHAKLKTPVQVDQEFFWGLLALPEGYEPKQVDKIVMGQLLNEFPFIERKQVWDAGKQNSKRIYIIHPPTPIEL